MERIKKSIGCLITLTLLTLALPAQTGTKWTLQDCLRYAESHNIQLNTLRLNWQSSKQDVWSAKGAKIPALAATAGNSVNNGFVTGTNGSNITDQLSNNGTYSLNSSVILWNSNSVNNNIRQQELIAQTAALSVEQARNNLSLQITQYYLDILLAHENIQYINSLVATSDSLVKQGELFYDAGSIAKVALLQLKSQLASDRYLQVQANNAFRQNILLLKQLLQLPTDSSFDIEVPSSLETDGNLPALTDVQQTALTHFPDAQIGQLGVQIADLGISKAKAATVPTLKAYGNIGSGYSNVLLHPVDPKTGVLTQNRNNLYENVGLTLSIPIFSQRINRANIEKAKINLRQADLDFQNTRLVLSQAVEQSYLNVENAIQSLAAAREQWLAATENYRIGKEQFSVGAISVYDLLVLRNSYVQAIQSYTQARYTAVLQRKIYEFYNGNAITL